MSKTGKRIFKNRRCNVILLDYSTLSKCSYIYLARLVVSDIGLYLSKCLNQWNLSLRRTQIVGHSLGAHIGGVAGYDLDGKISEITGMPNFRKIWNVTWNRTITVLFTDLQNNATVSKIANFRDIYRSRSSWSILHRS